VIVRFVVNERRVIRSIDYPGAKSVTVSEILDRFKERKVGLSVESQYDPNRVQRAAVVLKEFLAERGRQYASVEPTIRADSAVVVKGLLRGERGAEGEGRAHRYHRQPGQERQMGHQCDEEFLSPSGCRIRSCSRISSPRPTIAPSWMKTKSASARPTRTAGYFQAKTLEETVDIEHRGGKGWRLPLIKMNQPGISGGRESFRWKKGRLYKLHAMNFQGVKLFRTPEVLMKPLFGMTTGDVFSTDKLRKGIENMRKLYGEFGYIDFVPEPNFDIIPDTDQIDLTLTADEGKQFFIRRIDFSGNTTTRDKVIRREVLLDEGDMFNTKLWDYSILRLNQLGYFEMLKKEDSADIKRNPGSNTVDITLKVKERGKNSVGLNGGVSGIAGSFLGFNYSTNNFLGLGETLSVESQLGTRMRDVSFGFTEPYFLDRPLQLGFVVFLRRFNFDQGREASILAGNNLIPLYNQLGFAEPAELHAELQGCFPVSASYPIKAQLCAHRRHVRVSRRATSSRRPPRRRRTSSTSTSAALPARTRCRASPPATSCPRTRTTRSIIRFHPRPAAAYSSPPISRAACWAATSTRSAPQSTSSTSSRRPGTRATSWPSTVWPRWSPVTVAS
jgi:outer membrane protein insertion porin family